MTCHIWNKQRAPLLCFMCLQMDTLTESLVTLWASKFSCLDPFMLFQASIGDECPVTFGTYKRLFTSVNNFMLLQISTVCEWLVTFGTSKGLLSCVGLFMCLQMGTPAETFATLWASKLLLSCVDPHAFSNYHFVWITVHIGNKQTASLLFPC